MDKQITQIHCLVTGRVQGVFFRASTQQEASRLKLNGWVRNLADGRVEIMASGEQDAIQSLIDWLRQGPPMARIDEIDFIENEADNRELMDGFIIR